jgi:hypothetical protein
MQYSLPCYNENISVPWGTRGRVWRWRRSFPKWPRQFGHFLWHRCYATALSSMFFGSAILYSWLTIVFPYQLRSSATTEKCSRRPTLGSTEVLRTTRNRVFCKRLLIMFACTVQLTRDLSVGSTSEIYRRPPLLRAAPTLHAAAALLREISTCLEVQQQNHIYPFNSTLILPSLNLTFFCIPSTDYSPAPSFESDRSWKLYWCSESQWHLRHQHCFPSIVCPSMCYRDFSHIKCTMLDRCRGMTRLCSMSEQCLYVLCQTWMLLLPYPAGLLFSPT